MPRFLSTFGQKKSELRDFSQWPSQGSSSKSFGREVYGSVESLAKAARTFAQGRLQTSPRAGLLAFQQCTCHGQKATLSTITSLTKWLMDMSRKHDMSSSQGVAHVWSFLAHRAAMLLDARKVDKLTCCGCSGLFLKTRPNGWFSSSSCLGHGFDIVDPFINPSLLIGGVPLQK